MGPRVWVLPQRQTALVARQAADVDLLSGGRLRLGVGIGWNHVEYEALGQDFHTRGARQEEQVELLRRLFTEPVVNLSGRFDRVDRAALMPKPESSIPRFGLADLARRRSIELPGSLTVSSSSVAASRRRRSGPACVNGLLVPEGQWTSLAATMSR